MTEDSVCYSYSTNQGYDYINPEHYKKFTKEVWEMQLMIWGKDKFIAFCEMNIFKYRMRIGNKPGQDIGVELEKIKWYENKINELKK